MKESTDTLAKPSSPDGIRPCIPTAGLDVQRYHIRHTSAEERNAEPLVWYVLRDLKRQNAKKPGYVYLSDNGIETYVPMRVEETRVKGKRKLTKTVAISGLLFAHSRKNELARYIDTMPTLQFRYVRGGYKRPMTVREAEMENFIKAVEGTNNVDFHTIDEIAQLSIGKNALIHGGALDGVEGKIVNIRGSHKKRILVSIPDFIAAVVEVSSGEISVIE